MSRGAARERLVEPHGQNLWHPAVRPWGGILSDAPRGFVWRSQTCGGASRKVAWREASIKKPANDPGGLHPISSPTANDVGGFAGALRSKAHHEWLTGRSSGLRIILIPHLPFLWVFHPHMESGQLPSPR